MPAIISDKFRIFNAKQFIESFSEGSSDTGDERSRLYFFVGRPQRWDAYLEIYSQSATAFNVGDEVYIGTYTSNDDPDFRGIVREVYSDSLLLYNVTGTNGVSQVPTPGSTLKGRTGGATGTDTGATALTGIYRYGTEEFPVSPEDNQDEKYDVYDDLIAAKRITDQYVRSVIRRYNWQNNTTYDMWRPDYSPAGIGRTGNSTSTGQSSIADAKFFVMNAQYQVWKCLNNGTNPANPNGQVSTTEPSTGNPSYDSNTGLLVVGAYTWKYMYTIPTDDVLRFLSSDFMPIVSVGDATRSDTEGKAVPGAIDSYTVEDSGTGLPDGNFYAPVVGDGTGAYASITISSGAITSVSVTGRGQDYTYGEIFLKTGTGTSAADAVGLFNQSTTNFSSASAATVSASATGKIKVIIPPQGGHGSDFELELNGKRVMANIRLTYSEGFGDFPVDNDFRRIGIIKDPYERGTTNYATTDTLNGLTALKITGAGADYVPDEIVTQTVAGGIAKGTVVSWIPDSPGSFDGILKIFQSPRYHKDNGVVRAFENGANQINGEDSFTSGVVDQTYSVAVDPESDSPVSPFFGTFVGGISLPEIDNNSGDVIYIENRRLITRAADQIEDIKLVIEF